MNKYIALIPARGASKRFPRKNIYPLNGRPLIAYSIETALSSSVISDVYVSTDDEEIAFISKQYGSKVIKRPDELAGDFTTTAEVLHHAVDTLLKQGVEFDYVVLLQATNPLRPRNMIEDAICKIEKESFDSLVTVSPLLRKLGKIEDSHFVPWNYTFGQRSQDMDILYYENGLLYVSAKDLLLKYRIIGDNMYPMIIDHIYGTVDIDNKEDLLQAEFLINTQNE